LPLYFQVLDLIPYRPGLTNTLASLESTSDAVIDLTLPEAEAANADKASSADARGGRRDNEDSDDEVIIIAYVLSSMAIYLLTYISVAL